MLTREAKEDAARLAMVTGIFESCGREITAIGLRLWIKVLEPVPTEVLEPAVVAALGQAKGFMPLPGDVLEAARLAGRWQDLKRSAIRNPYWYRQIGQPLPITPDAVEPHRPKELAETASVPCGTS